jgi:hypothetical protein
MGDKLYSLRVHTKLGAEYVFPDMRGADVEHLHHQILKGSERVLLVNVSEAVLMLPFKIIKRIESREGEGLVKLGKVVWEWA